ncbi:MAG: transcriptional repressor [Nitrospiraceae bacterium]|nr:transcriptional repressor [Nitrospiraceae bacterium]
MKQAGGKKMKNTPQRLAIGRFLEGNRTHPSVEDVYGAVSKELKAISLATVYNTLETFRQAGEVMEIGIDPGRRRYDPNTAPHPHLMCIQCGKVIDVRIDSEPKLADTEKKGFDIVSSRVDFYGVCPACKGKKTGKGK